jgi:hypothetical protein
MSKVLSSDSSEHHSTPLSNNKERRGTNLMSSVSVLDNTSNIDEPSARQPSPIVSRGLISCSIVVVSSETSCKVPKRPISRPINPFLKVHQASVPHLSTSTAGAAPASAGIATASTFSWSVGSSRHQSQRLCVRKRLAFDPFNTPSSPTRNRPPSPQAHQALLRPT